MREPCRGTAAARSTPPPMGWNSWYCCSESVSDGRIRAAARGLVERGLAAHGWVWVNVDDCWQGGRGGPYGALQGNDRFPDMAGLGRHLHGLGLKFGLYSTPWIGSYAGYRGGSTDGGFEARLRLPADRRGQPDQLYGRYPSGLERGVFRIGSEWRFDRDARQWADWGVDLVKVDWFPNDVATTRRIRRDLDRSGREIALSLSNAAQVEMAPELLDCALCCRISGDIRDEWASIRHNGFERGAAWASHIGPGRYIDPDMLQIGNLGRPNRENVSFAPTALTEDEQRTQFTLWCLLSAPLLLSCDLETLDGRTLALLTNDAVIAVDQDPLAAPPRIERRDDGVQLYRKTRHDGSEAVGVFNCADERRTATVALGEGAVDLWSGEPRGGGEVVLPLRPHACRLFNHHPVRERRPSGERESSRHSLACP